MKSLTFFQFLTQQFKTGRRQHQSLNRSLRQGTGGAPKEKRQMGAQGLPPRRQKVLGKKSSWMRTDRSSAVFLIAVVSLTGVLGHRFYNQPQLNVGTIAPQTIKAPSAARLEDTEATQVNRTAASRIAVPVLMLDWAVNQQVIQNLQMLLDQGNELRQIAGPFPFAETSILSTSTQSYLRSCPDSQWQEVLAAVNNKRSSKDSEQLNSPRSFKNEAIAQAITELEAYRLTATPNEKFSDLIAKISQARQRYAQALTKLSELQAAKPATLYESSLLELSNANWWKTETGIRTSVERILAQGISPGLPSNILQEAVNLQVRSLVPAATEPLATELLLTVLKPNLKEDVEQTRQLAQQAASAVAPVMIEVQEGEVIVQAGNIISQTDFVMLDYFGLSRREINWLGLMHLGGVVVGAVGVFGLVVRRSNSKLRQCDRILILLLTLSTPVLAKVVAPYISLPAVGLLLGSFYGSPLGATVVGLLTVLLPVSLDIGRLQLLANAGGGLVASCLAGRMRSREELALLGVGVSLTQGLVYLLGSVIISTASGFSWYIVVREATFFGLSGLAWSIVALGLSPYLEHVFDIITPIRLAELANPNRPLLKRLATQAPGTFQHTLFVATLAEAAAKALECNVELVRTGTLYHDVGKLHDPSAFIENQMGGPNKHDEINDPWESAEIIKKHVSEGLVMARRHRLPTAIKQFIPEHQGTMLIAYFHHQAQQLAQQDSDILVQESDFRYDGPTPQSRESAIVMLADSCEAALRSLKDATPEEALAMVNKILRARWQDNQLVDSGLTRQEMSQLAEIFVEVWLQFHHKRIAYPKLGARG
ncbi:HDIG domain-containing metalloprotein [Chroococcidiopsis sp. CCMEE 29]|uniref:HD family phosphohydrolase n=1 Tax=Chroococcidiopsis sp. CCMEE 29 TaxID=155894 RepID=UPI0031F88524